MVTVCTIHSFPYNNYNLFRQRKCSDILFVFEEKKLAEDWSAELRHKRASGISIPLIPVLGSFIPLIPALGSRHRKSYGWVKKVI